MAVDIRIHGAANMGQVSRELNKVTATAAAMQRQFALANAAMDGDQQAQIRNYRQRSAHMGVLRDDMRDLVRSQGQFQVSSMKVGNQSDQMIERIQKQQLSFRGLRQELGAVQQAYRRHMALQRSAAMTWGTTAAGSMHVDLLTPKQIESHNRGLDSMRSKLGFYREVLGSVATQTVNWGKNTQWAGRQLMAGFTYPMAIAAGATGKFAYDIDKGLTQIVKVYGDAGSAMQETDEQIRKSAMITAKNLTQFGQSATDTLEIQGQLASTGKTGEELQAATEQVSKARLLGELNIQDAMQATINLQEVYQMSSVELGDAFNYMNAMENETSLTMQDFVVGIPKVSGVMKTLGADLQDTGIMLAAMKTAGINAREGGNAIKSMVFKDVAPSVTAIKRFAEMTGQSLTALVDQTGGAPIEMLQAIGAAIEDLDQPGKLRVMKEVFGIHQGGKAAGMIEALTEQTGQMATAFEIAGQSTEQWGDTAEKELEALKNANWVQFKATIEDIKIALADFGHEVLEAVIPALKSIAGALGDFAKWFSGLDDGTKKMYLIGAAIVAAAGPVIMITGLMGNLLGQSMNLVKFLTGAFTRGTELLTGKQAAQAAAAEKLNETLQRQSMIYNDLYKNVNRLATASFTIASPFSAGAHQLGMASPMHAKSSKVNGNINSGTLPVTAGISRASAMAIAPTEMITKGKNRTLPTVSGITTDKAELMRRIQKSSEKTDIAWRNIGSKMQGLGIAAGMFGSMATDSQSTLNNISNMVFTAALIGPAITGMLGKLKFPKFASNLSGTVGGAVTRGIGKGKVALNSLKTGVMGLAASAAAISGPLMIAVGAIGALAYAVHKHQKEAKERQEAYNTSLEKTGDLLGFITEESHKFEVGRKENTASEYKDLAGTLLSENKKFAQYIEKLDKTAKDQDAAIAEGIKRGQEGMIKYGWSKEEAMEAARVYATAINDQVANNINEKITINPFVEIKDVRVAQTDRAREAIKKVLEGGPDDEYFINTSTNVSGAPSYLMDLSKEGRKAITEGVVATWDVFEATEGKERKKTFARMANDMRTGIRGTYSDFTKAQKAAMEEEGVIDAQTLAEYTQRNGVGAVITHLRDEGAEMSRSQEDELRASFVVLEEMLMQFMVEASGRTEADIKKMFPNGLFDVNELVNLEGFDIQGGVNKVVYSNARLAESSQKYNDEIKRLERSRGELSYEEKRAILNAYRVQAGLKETTVLTDGMNREVSESTIAKREETDAVEENTKAKKKAIRLGKLSSYDQLESALNTDPVRTLQAYREGMEGLQQEYFDFVNQSLEDDHEAAINRIEKVHEAASKRLDAQQEKKEAAFDARQDRIDAAFDAKQEKFDAKWDNTMENFEDKWELKNEKFESQWDQTMENFDDKWERKTDRFDAQWDKTMENFKKRSEEAREAVEAQYDARIKKIEDAIEAERKAEETRQRIFEKEQARISHLASMANASININMALNSGDLDEAAKLYNDAWAAENSFQLEDASTISQTASEKLIESLEGRKEGVLERKDAAIERIENRMAAEEKALEHQREVARKTLEVARERERKILEEQRKREQKSLESQRENQQKSLESQRVAQQKSLDAHRKATQDRLEREREIFAKQIADQRETLQAQTDNKKRHETEAYNLTKIRLDREMDTLKSTTPRTRAEMQDHIDRIEKMYGKYGEGLKEKNDAWSKDMGEKMEEHNKAARKRMVKDSAWEEMGAKIADKIAKGSFDMNMDQFIKWINGGALPGSMPGGKKVARGTQRAAYMPGYHKGGVIDGTKSSRTGFSGNNQSQSEITINALKGESVLNRRATRMLGEDGVAALNSGAVPSSRTAKRIRDDKVNQRGDSVPMSPIAGVAALMAAAVGKGILSVGMQSLGQDKINRESFVGGGAIGAFIAAIREQESGGNYKAYNGMFGASGAYQYIPSTWNNYAGYSAAYLAPKEIQDMRAREDFLRDYERYGSWRKVASVHYSGQPDLHMSTRAQPGGPSIKGYVDSIINKMTGYMATMGGGGGPTGAVYPGMGYERMWQIVKKRFPNRERPSPGQLNQGGHSRNSYHYKNRAIDLGSAKSGGESMNSLYNWLLRNYGSRSTQIIYGPRANSNILNGRTHNYGWATNAAHMGHIHWAMQNGGVVPGVGRGDRTPIMGEPGEFMLRKKAVDNIGPEFLKMLNSDRFINMPKTAMAGVSGEQLASSVDSSYNPVYDIKIDARGNDNANDIAHEVHKVLVATERRKGFNRRIG